MTSTFCPNCNYDINFEEVLVIQHDQQALEKLFNGELNRLICDQCGNDFVYQTSLIYKNDEQKHFIYYLNDEINIQDANKHMDTIVKQMTKDIELEMLPEFRLVLSHQKFIEKIALSIDNLDDKIIEYIKMQIVKNERNFNPSLQELFYDFNHKDKETIEFIIWNKETKKPINNLRISKNYYEGIEQLLQNSQADIFYKYFVDYQHLRHD